MTPKPVHFPLSLVAVVPQPEPTASAQVVPPRPPAPSWDAYEHQPGARTKGARQVGLVNARGHVQRCACGGEIVVTRREYEADLVAAMATHQATPRHATWRARRGLGG